MEGNRTKPRALMVFGAPCSGKTTFAKKFAKKFGLAYYNFDTLADANGFSRENILVILGEIIKTGQTIIFEGAMNTEQDREDIRQILREAGYDSSLIWLQTDAATIRSRLKSRYKSVARAKEVYDSAVGELEAPSEFEKTIILSGKHTFDTQTRHVITGLADLVEVK